LRYFCDQSRHLVCIPYSRANLHTMAFQLGIGRHWFHGGRLAHYDIPILAMDRIVDKCEVVSSKDIVRIIKGTYNDKL
jgi:hypothetical protein